MRQRNLFLSVVLIGSCVGVAPTWSQTSPQTGDNPVVEKKTDKLDQGKLQGVKQSGIAGQSDDPTAKTQQTQSGNTPVADKQDKAMRQTSGETSMMNRRPTRSDVKKIQEALRDKGNDPGAIDGIIGPKTREALKSYQTANNLTASGRIDAETSRRLGVESSGSSIVR
jgi:Putative peptidoglycan-binding domain-containing protein